MPAGSCDFCGVEEYMPYACKFCKGRFCAAHRLPENHNCAGLGAYRERVREQGRVFQSDPLARPTITRTARGKASLHAGWAKLNGKMTWVFLGIIVATLILEWLVLFTLGGNAFDNVFVITSAWPSHPWTLVTNVFAHEPLNPWHIIGNGVVLIAFGPMLERLIGTKRFTGLFLAAGIGGSLVQVGMLSAFHQGDVGVLGASGAIMGLAGTLVVLAPTLSFLFLAILPVPLWAIVGLYVLLDIVGIIAPNGIAVFAHITGLVIGLGFGFYLRNRGLAPVLRPREPTIRRQF